MSRRIDVELTSARDDGTWTWRAAGARQPKGVVEAAVLYEGAKVGDVVRAEADFDIEGITILSVQPPTSRKSEPDPARIEVLGGPAPVAGVTSSLVPKSERLRRDDRRRRDGDERGPRPPRAPRDATAARRPRPPRDTTSPRPPRSDRPARAPRPEAPAVPERPKPKRLSPAHTHRSAVLEALSPEQRPVAEQVLRGGIPAVRQAVEAQNSAARADGSPEVPSAPLVAMAEELLPRLKLAEWRDRAEAAAKDVDEIALRDLRSVVAGAEAVARDDETRALASSLRETLQRRVAEQRETWVNDIATALDEGRLVRALRVSSRPPDPSTRFPADLAMRLADAAGAALSSEVTPDRWAAVLEAVSASPVRASVRPVGLPPEPGEPLLQAARQASGRVPALAALLGIAMPPPPRPARPPRAGGRPPRSRSFGQAAHRPARPAPATEAMATPPTAEETAPSADPGPQAAPAPVSEPRSAPDAPATEVVDAE